MGSNAYDVCVAPPNMGAWSMIVLLWQLFEYIARHILVFHYVAKPYLPNPDVRMCWEVHIIIKYEDLQD